MNSHPDRCNNTPEPQAATHLTPDQIDDHLIGDLAAAPAAHLAACALCTTRAAAAASPLASFQQVSTAWSERRSATLPIPVPAPRQPLWQRHMAMATACLSMAMGIAVINANHQFQLSTTEPQHTASAPTLAQQALAQLQPTPKAPALTETASIARSPQTAAHIAADNHMLQAVNAAFDPFAENPAALGLVSAESPSAAQPTSLQD
jgi:hypothetical protein